MLFWPYSFLNVYYFVTDNYPDSFEPYETISLILLQIGVIIVFIWLFVNAISVSRRFFKYADQREVFLSSIQLAGIFLLVIGIVFQLIENVTEINVWHTPLNVIAFILIGLPYIIDPKILLFAPVELLLFGVIDESGRTHYFNAVDPSFQDEKTIETTSQLFGGLTLAFSSIGKEVAKTEQGIDSLQFSDRSLIVEYLPPYYLVVLANRSTFFLEKEMEEYIRSLTKEYPKTPRDGSVVPEELFDRLNKEFFPVISKRVR